MVLGGLRKGEGSGARGGERVTLSHTQAGRGLDEGEAKGGLDW